MDAHPNILNPACCKFKRGLTRMILAGRAFMDEVLRNLPGSVENTPPSTTSSRM